MENDKLVRLSDVETELLKVTERYTVAHEANGMGRVVWSDNLISASCALNAVRSIPAVDAVEVVRCGECKHNLRPDKPNSICEFDIPIFDIYGYCSEGERREDGENDEVN